MSEVPLLFKYSAHAPSPGDTHVDHHSVTVRLLFYSRWKCRVLTNDVPAAHRFHFQVFVVLVGTAEPLFRPEEQWAAVLCRFSLIIIIIYEATKSKKIMFLQSLLSLTLRDVLFIGLTGSYWINALVDTQSKGQIKTK